MTFPWFKSEEICWNIAIETTFYNDASVIKMNTIQMSSQNVWYVMSILIRLFLRFGGL